MDKQQNVFQNNSKRMIYCLYTTKTNLILFYALILAFLPIAFISCEPVNVALNRPVTALYTCGRFGMEYYNTILDTEKSYAERQELSCNDLRLNGNPEAVKTPTHGPLMMVDGDSSTWWQSTSRNRRYHYGDELRAEMNRLLEVLINVDLQQEFLAEKVIIQLGDALSPQKIEIQKSLDGKTYRPWIYAVSSATWCSTFFETTFNTVPADENSTVCLGYEADGFAPGDNIQLDVSKIPDVLKEWTRIRYVKIKFYDMLFAYPYNQLANTFNHYAVRELSVMAECPCNGQQSDCQPSPTTGQYECVCGGNTKGRFCESCMAMFNQYQFQQGVACQECNCFNHATSCFYRPTVEQNNESLDKEGNRKGGGVCLDCQHFTTGNNCEKCVSMYYRPTGVTQTSENTCVACGCSQAGSSINPSTGIVDCVMNDDEARTDGKAPGDCFCKANVQGIKCDTCKSGFYKLDQSHDEGCIECACFTSGTVGASALCTGDASGQCQCKANVEGRACDKCKDGFYGLSAENGDGCIACGCDVGGAVDHNCDKDSGQCTCRSNSIVGRTCNSVDSEFYYPSAHAIHDEFEDSFGFLKWKSDQQYSGFSGKGYAEPDAQDDLSVLLNIPNSDKLSGNFTLVIFYRSPMGETADGVVSIVSKTSDDKTPNSLTLPLCTGKWCSANTGLSKLLELSSGPNLFSVTLTSGSVLLDKIVAVPIEHTTASEILSTPLPAGCDFLQNTIPESTAEAASCKQALFSVTMYYWESALPCYCDVTGSVNPVCEANGGQCSCHGGIIGRQCDMCAPDHYGFSSTGCKSCDCDSLTSSCDPNTGQCECPDNTFGRQCEFCLPGSWGWEKTQGCKDCNCDSDGAAFPQCNDTTGICTCKPGVQGDKCDECKDNFYNLNSMGCSPCACALGGSKSTACNKTSGQCECKANTAGRQCNQCLSGTFGLDDDNTDGCLNCVCMGVTAQCTSSDTKFSSEPFALSKTSDNGTTPNLQVATVDGNVFATEIEVETGDNQLTSTLQFSYESGQQVIYWKMPDILISNLLNLYGSIITVSVNYINVDGTALSNLKAIILTSDGKKVNADFDTVNEGFETTISVSVREQSWNLDGASAALDRKEFLKVLARGSAMLIPATFSSGKHTSRLSRLQFNVPSEVGVVNPSVELCQCGSSYSGSSCERCAEGFKRTTTNLTEYFGECATCECNGHSSVCDEDTSECLQCQHNTVGRSCEQCALGYYGDATGGTAVDCLACPCIQPRVVDASCHAEDVNGTTTVKCDNCRDGYIGDLCNQCDAAYYGNPGDIGGTCTRCDCNGNADSCDSVTGVCQNCQANTVGDNCGKCADTFYGNATAQNCQACECSNTSSTSTICDSASGQCPCVIGVGGRTCDKCLDDYWGFDNDTFVGCKPCGCNAAGSVSTQCAGDTGQCTCKANTEGDVCDSCSQDYFGLPLAPCQACDCDVMGTMPDTTCNVTNGQCSCQYGVGGRKCDQCLPLYVNFTSTGCLECDQCQRALGTSVEELTTNVTAFVETARIVFAVQNEDTRLQNLTTQLETSLEQVGLTGSDATSVSDVLNNITSMQTTLQASFATTKNEVTVLSAAASDLNTKSNNEATEQQGMLTSVNGINSQLTTFERDLATNVQTLVQYNNSASKLAEQGKGAGTITLDLSSDTAAANDLLAKVEDVGDIEAVIETINSQQPLTSTQMTSQQTLKEQFDNESLRIDDLTSELNTVAFNVGVTDNSLDEALTFKSQAEELLKAVQTILTSTENDNNALASTITSAEVAVTNTNSIYNGDARPLMQGEDAIPFPNGVTNYENGKSRLEVLISAITLLVDQTSTSVTGSEAHVADLQKELESLNTTFKDLPAIGKEANAAIQNYELVIEDLDKSVQMADTASSLITQVQNDLSGDSLQERNTSYEQEKQTSEAFRDELVQLDYKPQVLENTISGQRAQLDKEADDWKQADVKVEEMSTASLALTTKLEDNSLISELTAAESKVKEAATKSTNVAASVEGQSKVLDQKETELETTKSQIDQVKQLDTQVRSDLNAHLAAFNDVQTKVNDASTAKDTGLASTETISDKIKLLEAKLAKAEGLLERLRQPRTFDGSLSLQITNPKANSGSSINSLSLTVRKAAGFSDGNIFFTENQNNDEEFEVGIKSSQVFFEFFTSGKKITVTNPAEICDDCWAKVQASRLGNVGYLSVTKLPSGEVTSTSSSSTPQSITSPITLTTPLYVGSLPQDTNIIKVTNKQFEGCLMDINFENQAINLWSAAVSSNQEAKCCEAPPTSTSTTLSEGSSFSGFGFLVLNSQVFTTFESFSFEFRTYSSSGTIFLVSSEDAQSLVSISMSSGLVVYNTKINGNEVSIKTDNAYNTGKWAKVALQTSAGQMQLIVNFLDAPGNAETKTTPLVDLSTLGGRSLIIGASSDPFTTGTTSEQASSTLLSKVDNTYFFGCLRKVEYKLPTASQTEVLNLKENVIIQEAVLHGGCFQNVVKGLQLLTDSAYARVSNENNVAQISSLEIKFTTTQDNGVLLYADASGTTRYLYAGIFGGHVLLKYQQENSGVVIGERMYVSDGQEHTLSIDMTTSRVSMSVDGVFFEESSQTLTSAQLTFGENGKLYLGGTLPDALSSENFPSIKSFMGGITSFLFNGISFNNWMQSSFDQWKDTSLAGVSQPTTVEINSDNCATKSTLQPIPEQLGILLDGTTPISWSNHVESGQQLVTYFNSQFTLEFDFAAYKSDAVFLYVADDLVNPSVYYTIYMESGKISLRMRTSSGIVRGAQLSGNYNTGQRFQMSASRDNDFGTINIGSNDFANTGASESTPSTLEIPLSVGVYIAGIGNYARLQSPLPGSFQTDTSLINFAGAFYSVKLTENGNQKTLLISTLNRETYPAVPQQVTYGLSLSGVSSYLGLGTATLTQENTIEMKMSTTTESALLFALYADSKYIICGYNKQQITLFLSSSFTGVTTRAILVVFTLPGTSVLCDGKTHTITFQLTSKQATVVVDGVSIVSRIPTTHAIQPFTATTFTIGGLPDEAPNFSGASTSSFAGCVESVKLTTGDGTTNYDPTQYGLTSSGFEYGCPV